MRKHWLLSILSLSLALSVIIFTTNAVNALNDYKADKEAIAETLNFKERVMTSTEWIPLNDVAAKKAYVHDSLQRSANLNYDSAVYYGLFIVGAIVLYLIVVGFYYWQTIFFNQMFGIALIVSSLCLIYLSLQAPFLEIEAFNIDLAFKVPVDLGFWERTFEKTFDGKVSYFYQNKSVFQLIKLLFTGGNIVVGIALVLFSVVFPVFKLLASLFVLLFPAQKQSPLFTKIILKIGKWSMADVFVAGIFLAYFSFSNMNVGVETNAETLLGLYFFLGFVILSIASSYFVKKVSANAVT